MIVADEGIRKFFSPIMKKNHGNWDEKCVRKKLFVRIYSYEILNYIMRNSQNEAYHAKNH